MVISNENREIYILGGVICTFYKASNLLLVWSTIGPAELVKVLYPSSADVRLKFVCLFVVAV